MCPWRPLGCSHRASVMQSKLVWKLPCRCRTTGQVTIGKICFCFDWTNTKTMYFYVLFGKGQEFVLWKNLHHTWTINLHWVNNYLTECLVSRLYIASFSGTNNIQVLIQSSLVLLWNVSLVKKMSQILMGNSTSDCASDHTGLLNQSVISVHVGFRGNWMLFYLPEKIYSV